MYEREYRLFGREPRHYFLDRFEARYLPRDWREEARQKREANMTFIRQLASGSRKRLPKAERTAIMDASKQ